MLNEPRGEFILLLPQGMSSLFGCSTAGWNFSLYLPFLSSELTYSKEGQRRGCLYLISNPAL
uniref:Uncharacterized protein n=1 Tax=Utricularia reniformis TaxID=192314 RepID=A0A1Y0B4A5_9LAMI|nr:hypothetical protein AEK19_MT2075 [Utricularia reniformis]ART32230.1 hypothetical protein AEK19_MT2075 [Utricularia reniformis]